MGDIDIGSDAHEEAVEQDEEELKAQLGSGLADRRLGLWEIEDALELAYDEMLGMGQRL